MTPFQTLGQTDALKPIRRAAVGALRPSYTRARPIMAIRTELPVLLNRRGLLGIGAEVGVKRGHFSQDLLSAWHGAQLISIDPWLADPSGGYHDKANVTQEQHDAYFAETMERLRPFGDRSAIWRMVSTEAAAAIDPGSLDFVYIDARHDHDSVLEDLAAWFPLVRPGGVIAGHDYINGVRAEGEFGVRRAVDEFFADHALRVTSTFADAPWPSWLVVVA
jgi:hypothetical protein